MVGKVSERVLLREGLYFMFSLVFANDANVFDLR